jgi:hypothetical protein
MPPSLRGCGGISPARADSSKLTSHGLSFPLFCLRFGSAFGPLDAGQGALGRDSVRSGPSALT